MPVLRRIRSIVRVTADRLLPDRLYFPVICFLYLLGNKKRRGSRTRFMVTGEKTYSAKDPDATEIFFCERRRLGLYHYPGGVKRRIDKVLAKYSFGDVSVAQGDVVIDVGANLGEFTLAVSHLASRVLAIDPDPNVQTALALNLQKLPNAEIFPLALSDTDGEVEFFVSTAEADSSIVKPERFSNIIKVPACRLDTLVENAGIERVDFLKLEAEGWEPEILAGAQRTLSMTRKVAVDAGPERYGEPTADAVMAALSDAGFNVVQKDFIVFASRPEPGS